MTPAAGDPWQPDPVELADFLRRRGLRVGTGDVLRALALLERLRLLGRAPATAAEAAPLLAPILCTSRRHQEMLGAWLHEFAGPAPTPVISAAEPETPAVSVPPQERWRLGRVTVFAVLGLVGLAIALRLLGLQVGAGGAGSGAGELGGEAVGNFPWLEAGLRAFLTAAPLMLAPLLLGLAWVVWRGDRFPAMARGVYAGGPVSRLRTGGDREARFLYSGETFRDAVKKLRQHRRVRSRRVDARLSVRATIAHAGQPRLERAWSVTVPDYPLLVHTVSTRDHLDYLAQTFSLRLTEGGVHHGLYRFSVDPRFLWDELGATTSLADLAGRYGGDVLLFFGDGAAMVEPVTLSLRPWAAELQDWRVVVLLTPLPRSRWSWRERRLSEAGIVVLPATSEGVAMLGAFLAEGGRPPNPALQRSPARASLLTVEGVHASRFHMEAIPSPAEREEIYDAIVQDVPEGAIDVLCMAALFPECRPDLLAHLGDVVRDGERPLLDEEGFGVLCTLPWLRYGRLPDWLRLGLVQALDKGREDEARVLLPQWVGTTPDRRGVAVADPKGTVPLPSDKMLDVIYLRLIRNEDLASLELKAPNDLRRLAQNARRLRLRWPLGIAGGVALTAGLGVLMASQTVEDAAVALASSDLVAWMVIASVSVSLILTYWELVARQRQRARRAAALVSAGLATFPCFALFATNPLLIGTLLTGHLPLLLRPDRDPAPAAAPVLPPGAVALLVPWFALLSWLEDGTMIPNFQLTGGMVVHVAVMPLIAAGAFGRPLLRVALGSAIGFAAALQLAVFMSALTSMVGPYRIDESLTGLLFMGPLVGTIAVAAAPDVARLRRILVYGAVCAALLCGTVFVARAMVGGAGIRTCVPVAVGLALSYATSFDNRVPRLPQTRRRAADIVVAAASAAVLLSVQTEFAGWASRRLLLVVGLVLAHLGLRRCWPDRLSWATVGLWAVTLDWSEGLGTDLGQQILFIPGAALLVGRWGARAWPAVLAGGLPLLWPIDERLWGLLSKPDLDILFAGLLAAAVTQLAAGFSADRGVAAYLSGARPPELVALSLLPAAGAVLVAAGLFSPYSLPLPLFLPWTHAILTLFVGLTASSAVRPHFVAWPGPIAVVLAVLAVHNDVGGAYQIPWPLLVPFLLLIASTLLKVALLDEHLFRRGRRFGAEVLLIVAQLGPLAALASTHTVATPASLILGAALASLFVPNMYRVIRDVLSQPGPATRRLVGPKGVSPTSALAGALPLVWGVPTLFHYGTDLVAQSVTALMVGIGLAAVWRSLVKTDDSPIRALARTDSLSRRLEFLKTWASGPPRSAPGMGAEHSSVQA